MMSLPTKVKKTKILFRAPHIPPLFQPKCLNESKRPGGVSMDIYLTVTDVTSFICLFGIMHCSQGYHQRGKGAFIFLKEAKITKQLILRELLNGKGNM